MKSRMESKMSSPVVVGVDIGKEVFQSSGSPPMGRLPSEEGSGDCVSKMPSCKACLHQVEPDPGEMAARYGVATPVLDWRERLVCSRCGSREVDMVLMGTR